MLSVGVLGHLLINELQNSGQFAEQPEPAAAGLLEEKLFTYHKYTKINIIGTDKIINRQLQRPTLFGKA